MAALPCTCGARGLCTACVLASFETPAATANAGAKGNTARVEAAQGHDAEDRADTCGAPPAGGRPALLRIRASELRAGDVIETSGAVVVQGAFVNAQRHAEFAVRFPSGQVWGREWNPRTEVRIRREAPASTGGERG